PAGGIACADAIEAGPRDHSSECDAAIPGPPWNAPFCAWRGDPNRTAPFHAPTQKDNDAHDEAHPSDLTPWSQPPPASEGDRRRGRLARRGPVELSRRRLCARGGSGSDQGDARVHRAE